MTQATAHARILLIVASLTALVLAAATTHAHRVNIFAWVEGDVVHAEAAFSGGKPAKDSPVTVMNADTGVIYLEAKTDAAGEFSFTIPEAARADKANLSLHLHASMGHEDNWVITAEEYLGTDASAEPAPEAAPDAIRAAPLAAGGGVENLDRLVETAVGKALEKHLAPIKRTLAQQSEAGPDLADVVGGLGWIVGLIGMYAWGRSRQGRA